MPGGYHSATTQSVRVADCSFIVNILDLWLALPIAIAIALPIAIAKYVCKSMLNKR